MKGVVWQEPEDLEQAEADLLLMHRMGIEAVRTDLLRHADLLTHADTLGLQLFQELPVAYLPAEQLLDTLGYAVRLLNAAVVRAQQHPSARYFGLARHSDTSDPDACTFFEQLIGQVGTAASADMQFYYLSPFTDADRCHTSVDFVLLDARSVEHPSSLLAHRRDAALGPSGLGAVGRWVRSDTLRGLRVLGSPEQQARYLETHLNTLLKETTRAPDVVVFVYQWRDMQRDTSVVRVGGADPYGRSYGLQTSEGTARLALGVVEGIYTTEQRVFAFPAGQEQSAPIPWVILVGWIMLVLLGGLYAASPRFRFMVPRYFMAHVFYCDAVRQGRDVLPVASLILLGLLGASVGIQSVVVLGAVQEGAAFLMLLRWIPDTVRDLIIPLFGNTWLLMLLFGGFYALGLAVWGGIIAFATSFRRRLMPGQVLMLMVWPRWTQVILMVAAMVISTLRVDVLNGAVVLLILAWLVLSLWAMVRTVLDLGQITRVSGRLLFVLALANPLVVLLAATAVFSLLYGPEASYLWHLLVRW